MSASSMVGAITGKTNIVGLIGWPTGHSVSPRMHNAAFTSLDADWCYVPLPVPNDPKTRIEEAVKGLRALGLKGANVTVPYKQAVIPYLDSLSPAATAIGAVNTIVVRDDGTFFGDNTDAPGFIADLQDHGVAPKDNNCLVIGAGGSSRAIVYGVAAAGANAVTVLNRTLDRAVDLVASLQPHFDNCTLRSGTFPQDLALYGGTCTIIVNCTTLGMTPNIESIPWTPELSFNRDQVVYDLVYNPRQTRLLAKAELDGGRAIGGIGMLVWQGAIAFEHWTGVKAPVGVMRQAIGA